MNFRMFAMLAALAVALSVGVVDAFARPGGGSSVGSRGARTYTTPPATRTAPSAAPIQRSVTPQAAPAAGRNLNQPAAGGFGRGLMGGLMGGLLGAGLFGLLSGSGLFGGMGGLMSILGLVLQIGLIVLAVRFAINFFRRRQTAGAGANGAAFSGGQPFASGPQGAGLGGGLGAGLGGGSSSAQNAARTTPLQVAKSDFDAFERRLGEVQAAYSAEDIGALRRLGTPEIAAHFEQEIANNSSRGLVNKVSNVRLLQGDLAEAWREPDAEYATVAMRFALNDALVEKATGRVVSGSTTAPEEVTEIWTFRRPSGADSSAWALSAMQQAA
ncbi:MAG: TIM44-like domain-containing protein [Rhodoblastus sp.]